MQAVQVMFAVAVQGAVMYEPAEQLVPQVRQTGFVEAVHVPERY